MSANMDIFNRPPTISEDTVQYTLYPPPHLSDKTSATTLAALVREHVDNLLPDHLWHRDAFELKVVPDPDGRGWILNGRMRVGDSVDDEWCVVWLMKEISSKWDVAISIFDSDGEFLLIEAAEHLPSWVTPQNAENRVWIYNSALHLVPISHISPPSTKPRRRRYTGTAESDDEGNGLESDDDYISIRDAEKLVRDTNVDTRAPEEVEKAVWNRISGYPAAAKQHIHIAKAYLPVDIAKALSINPSLVQKPVETFYTRDAIQLRAAHKMSRFPPEPSVLTTVKMTRTAYAQLVGQKFYPPKIFGRWKEKEGTKEWRWRDVGMKLACGFEMLYQESKGRSTSSDVLKSSLDARKDALRRNPEYNTYIDNLVSTGYFRGELRGSQLWNELEDKAANSFIEVRREDDATRTTFTDAVNAAVMQAGENPTFVDRDEDPDDWLNIDASDFDAMLEKTMGQSSTRGNTKGKAEDAMDVDEVKEESREDMAAKLQAARLQALAQKVEEFVEGKGDIEGARFADEKVSDDDDDDEDEEFSDEHFSDDESSDDDAMQRDEPENRAERQAAMDKLVPGLEPSDYGKMPPSFHSNSQRVAPVTMETDIREVPVPSASTTGAKVPPIPRTIRPPILPRDQYEGVDSDDETDEEDDANGHDEEEEEDQPQVVGEVEIDMDQEQDEFLEFARQALGMSDEQWSDILNERRGRGAFVPDHTSEKKTSKIPTNTSSEQTDKPARRPAPGPRPNVNPNLDSFETVMQAMDAELARSRPSATRTPASSTAEKPVSTADNGKGKAKATDESSPGDIEAAMDAELREALGREDGGDDDDEMNQDSMDYNLIKNFLESFKSQGGLSGPVGNLAGRLQPGWTLPRDES